MANQNELTGIFQAVLEQLSQLRSTLESHRRLMPEASLKDMQNVGEKLQTELESFIEEQTADLNKIIQILQKNKTTHEKLEADLRTKEAAIASSINGIGMADFNGNIIYVNKAALEMWAYTSPQQVLGHSALEFFASRDLAEQALNTVKNAGHWRGDIVALRADGSRFYVHLSAYTVHDSKGIPLCLMASFIDISDRIKIEQTLRDSEAMLSKAQEIAHIGTWRWNPTTNDLVLSDEIPRIYGRESNVSQGDVLKLVKETTHPDDWVRLRSLIDKALNEKTTSSIEYRVVRPNGEVRCIWADGTVIQDQHGNLIELFGVIQDITERKRTEQALRESEERFRNLVENAPEAIILYDVETQHVVDASPKGFELLGMDREKLLNISFNDICAPVQPGGISLDQAINNISRTISKGVVPIPAFEWIFMNKHEEQIPCEVRLVRLITQGRSLYLASITDIRERKRSENLITRLGRIIDYSSNEIYVFDADTLRFLQVNHGAQLNTGYDIDELLALTPLDMAPRLDKNTFKKLLAPLIKGREECVLVNTQFKRRDGSSYPVEMRLQFSPQETPPVFLAIVQDITQRETDEAQMAKLSSALQQTADAVVITDNNGVIEYVNSAFENITGYSSTEVMGKNPSLLNSGKHPKGFYKKMWKIISAGNVFRDVIVNRKKDGALFYEEQTITPLRDMSGKVINYIATGKDITERMQTQERLHHLAYHDVITELPNRSLLMERLEQALVRARRHKREVAILFLDLDRFKNINDTLGHMVGDLLLQQVSVRISKLVRNSDTVARLGGDEFAILLDDLTSYSDIAHIAQNVLNAFNRHFKMDKHELFVNTSIGISVYPTDGKDGASLLKNADVAMYKAKKLGGNNYQFYTADMTTIAFERLSMENSLRRALDRSEFELYYQPQLIVDTGKITTFEALLRWRHPEHGLIQPSRFISLLEETGLIMAVGEWVLHRACADAKAWQRDHFSGVRVSVNLSGRQLNNPRFLETIDKVLNHTGLNPKLLEIEITETVIMEYASQTLNTLNRLKEKGIGIAIDDFGTGYSSLSYLKRFPIDTLKIDQSFVRDIPQNIDDSTIVTTVLAMANIMHLNAIAEGVETDAQLTFLRDHHCYGIQGFYYSPPVPKSDLAQLVIGDW